MARTGMRRRIRRAAAVALMVGVAAGTLAVSTAAQASWTPVTTLTARNWEGVSPVISAGKSGDFLTAWEGINNAAPDCYNQIQIRTRSRTGTWGSIHQLTPCGPPMDFPVVTSNAGGYGVVAWVRSDNDAIQAALVSPAGKPGPVLTVTPRYNQTSLVNVAMSPTGQALVVWQGRQTQGSAPDTILGRFINPNSTLGPLLGIGGGTSQLPSVVFDKTGTATVAWSEWTRAMAERVTPKGAGKSTAILVPAPAAANSTSYGVPLLADDSNGDTFVLDAVDVTTKTTRTEHLVLRKWSKAGLLGPAITVGTAAPTVTVTNIADRPALAADGAGDAVVVWDSSLSSSQAAVYGRRVSPAGRLGSAVRLGTGFLPQIAVDLAGSGLISWQTTPFGSGYPAKVYGRRVTATTGTFGALLELTADGKYAQLAADQAGHFGVIWERSSLGSLIQARFGP